MSPLREVALLVERELVRNVRSAKGLVLALICLLGGTGTTLAGISTTRLYEKADAQQVHQLREQALTAAYGSEIGKYLADAPEVMYAMMAGTIALAALLATLLGFDAISAELQHRGVRYWTVRSRRVSYVAGKFFGLFAVASAMTLLMHVCSWIAIAAKSDLTLGVIASWGLRFWLVTLPVSAAWCALVTFFSALFRTPIVALLVACLAWLALGLTYVVGKVTERDALTWLYPNGFDRLLLSPSADKMLGGIAASCGFAALFVAGAVVLFQQRDV